MTSWNDLRLDVRRALPTIVAARFLINVAMRMGYTFLPAFARGAGLSVEATSTALSARELTSLSAPWTGKASDRFGPIAVMSWGGVLAAIGMLVATLGSVGFVVGLITLGFGRTAHQVALNGWIGSVVAYERRGRVTGVIEMSWGGAALLGLPLVGLLIDGVAWWMPLLLLGVGVLGLSTGLRGHIQRAEDIDSGPNRRPLMTRPVVAALATNGAMTAAAQFLFLGHGLWLEDTYDLDTGEIGLAVVAVGLVEVVATLGSSRLTDRVGKRRSMIAGTVLMTLALAVLAAFSAPPLGVALALLVAAFLGFEYGIVSGIPLISELDPGARAEMVGRAFSVTTVVRAVITLVATGLYLQYGFGVMMTVAACTGVVAIVLGVTAMEEPEGSGDSKEPGGGWVNRRR